MRNRVERIRIWLLGGTFVLLLMLVGFLGYAHYRSRAFLAGLPGKLGAEITRETNGYTYSQTLQGRTVFTLHASKLEQRKDGVVHLHDVGIVLYGRKQDRADRIYGSDFEYDQAKGVVRALGVVHMDLQAPSPAEGAGKKQAALNPTEGELKGKDPKVIHLLTSGLVYLTNLGVAATKEDVEFSEGPLTGRARGADYNSDTGLVNLQSAVRLNGLAGGGPVALTASHAELNQAEQMVTLATAKVVTGGQTVEAVTAVVHLRKDGSPERLEGWGPVRISNEAGGSVIADRAEGNLDPAGKPLTLRLWDGVRYTEDDAARTAQGEAAEVRVRFDGAGRAEHMTASQARMEERVKSPGRESSRVLTGRVVEVALAPAATARKSEVRNVEATGAAHLTVSQSGAGSAGPMQTEIAGDMLRARIAGRTVSDVVATGHTSLHRSVKGGADEASEADSTELVFRTAQQTAGMRGNERKAASGDTGGLEQMASATQTGHVAMVRTLTRTRNGSVEPVVERAGADRAVYDGDSDGVRLTGEVKVESTDSTLWARQVALNRRSGEATAEGAVRMNYRQEAADGTEREPVHVLADRAELYGTANGGAAAGGKDDRRRVLFHGLPARMWQGTSQVEAPTITLDQAAKRLTASSDPSGMGVRTILLENGDALGGDQGGGTGARRRGNPTGKETEAKVVRVLSREMVYTDASREVVFSGGVLLEETERRIKAQKATVLLQAGSPGSSAGKRGGAGAPALFGGGNVEKIVATGGVELAQPGRRAAGEQLVYTAADGMFGLTGTAGALPWVEDEARGRVTGAEVRFHAGDNRVVVTSESIQSGGTGSGKRRAETRVKQ